MITLPIIQYFRRRFLFQMGIYMGLSIISVIGFVFYTKIMEPAVGDGFLHWIAMVVVATLVQIWYYFKLSPNVY